jgi:hypothetical protein
MAGVVTDKTTATTGLDTSVIANYILNGTSPVRTGQGLASTLVAGFAKSINMFYKLLMTEKGSNPLDQQEGTGFSSLFQSNITDIDTLYVDVKSYVSDAFDQLNAIQTQGLATAAEKLTAVDIVAFKTVVPGTDSPATGLGTSLNVSLSFYNAAGDQSPLELPSTVLT